jgi:hypothetical protein
MNYGSTEFMGLPISPAVEAACGPPPSVQPGLNVGGSEIPAYFECATQARLEESCRNPVRASSILAMGGMGLFLGAGAGALLGALFGKTKGGAITGAVLGTSVVVLPSVLLVSSVKKKCAREGLEWGA